MEDLGFVCTPGVNEADCLTDVTIPSERCIRSGYEGRFPRNVDEILTAFRKSNTYNLAELSYSSTDETILNTHNFQASIALEKCTQLPRISPLTTDLFHQFLACTIRHYQIIWCDKETLLIEQISSLIQALVVGSLFHKVPPTSDGLFIKGGAVLFSILYNSVVAMSGVTVSFSGHPILLKQKGFAFHHPAAYCIVQIIADIPILLFQVSIFSIVLYFMVGLKETAGSFFTYWIIVFAITMCLTAMFRAISSAFNTFDGASKVSGFMIMAAVLYAGYMIERPKMHP